MSRLNKYVCIHGHFYQPPRENAWLEIVEQQESAHPYHDWNSRINHECYAPNAAARILDNESWIVKIRNNYNRISWNFGPTLLSWLEENDPDAYSMLLKADKRSIELCGGHGSAIAQVHSHLIMPLCNPRDKVTQITWGIKDFEYRFGRYPEGLWLSETAVNTETLEVLASHGIQFTILAPRQAKAIRKIGAGETWKNVDAESVDTRQAYWCTLPSGRRIALYFYHGRIAQEVAFNGLLNNGKTFAQRMLGIFDDTDTPQIAHIATDGESYGHHHRYGEMALADCLNYVEDNQLATLTNYAQFLELHPPQWEAQIHENSSWSCVHGVERWRSDCGCNTGKAGWHQRWRKPLRNTLDWLRDELSPIFEKEGSRLLKDPWSARNAYIEVMLDRSDSNVEDFLQKHAKKKLSHTEKVTVLRLLEIQRFALLMYTSCGWFFDEISGIETNQILQYALRAMDYTFDVTGDDFRPEFIRRLAAAPSNVLPNGAESFVNNVVPTRVTLERVAMHFAVASLFENDPEMLDLFNYTASVEFLEKISAGTPQFAAGRIRIKSKLSHAERLFSFAVLYLGQQHIIGNISEDMLRSQFEEMYARTSKAFRAANLGEVIGALQEYFGPEKFTLSSLFTDEKISIIRTITDTSLSGAEAALRNVFNDSYQLMTALEDSKMPIPSAWNNVASYVLNVDLLKFFEGNETSDTRNLRRTIADMDRWHIEQADQEKLEHAMSQRILREIEKIGMDESSVSRVRWLADVLTIVKEMNLKPSIWRSQNMFYLLTKGRRKGIWVFLNKEWEAEFERLATLLKVRLKVDK